MENEGVICNSTSEGLSKWLKEIFFVLITKPAPSLRYGRDVLHQRQLGWRTHPASAFSHGKEP